MFSVTLRFKFENLAGLNAVMVSEKLGVIGEEFHLSIEDSSLKVSVSKDFAVKIFNCNDAYFRKRFNEILSVGMSDVMLTLPKEAFILEDDPISSETKKLCFNPKFWNEQVLQEYLPQFKIKQTAEPKSEKKWWKLWR